MSSVLNIDKRFGSFGVVEADEVGELARPLPTNSRTRPIPGT